MAFFVAVLLLLSVHLPLLAETPAKSPIFLPEIIRQIENRRGDWIAFKANLTLHFLTSDHNTASCRAELNYQRLEEKILLKGFNAKNELLFVFKTTDRTFELYLPNRKTIFRGTIFDLEDSPDIESHLKPLDLYRALKPMAIPLEDAAVSPAGPPQRRRIRPLAENRRVRLRRKNRGTETVSLQINGTHRGLAYVARRVMVTEEGDVQVETYYSFEEKPVLIIHRSEFKKIRSSGEGEEKAVFPHKIKLENPAIQEPGLERNLSETVLLFKGIDFRTSLPEEEWFFSVPKGTIISVLSSA